jgi:tetratricopeptide (TPR) repeat protein
VSDTRTSLTIRTCFIATVTLALCATSFGQTFEIGSPAHSAPAAPSKKGPGRTAPQDSGMGWGSSIEVAREARAAQAALQKSDYHSAVFHAEHAAKAAPQNPDLWFLLAYAARLAGQYSSSVDAYKRGLQERPSSIEGLSGLAQTYVKMGRGAEAQQILEQVIAASPKSEADLSLAGELVLPSDPEQALAYLSRADTIHASARNELLMARAYERLGDKSRAKELLDRARSTSPRDPDVLRSVASYYRDTGQYDLAISTLKSVPSEAPSYLSELAYTYELAGKKSEAANTFLQAANKAPGQAELQLNAAQALINAKESGRAEPLLKRVEAMQPNHYRLHAVRAELARSNRQNQGALREYELALQAMPPSVPEGVLYPIAVRLNLAQLYRDAGESDKAGSEAEAARSALATIDIVGPGRPEFLRLKAASAVGAGDYKEAEDDLREALRLQPANSNVLLNYANLLWKTNRTDLALKTYLQALDIDSGNPSALESLGYLSREMGDANAARSYFERLNRLQPNDYVPYLAMGDMYSQVRDFPQAQANYEKAYSLAPEDPLIIAGATNAALEAHETPNAKRWLEHASKAESANPQVMRERERYLTITGNYEESAKLGYAVIEQLPRDPEGPVYLAYDLLFMNRYDDAMTIVRRFEPVLPKDRDLPLISGYIHAHRSEFQSAVDDFTRALDRDPQMATGYMNRGYVWNDLRMATNAEQDFRKAILLRPDYGEAHLGLAYSLLQLRRAQAALKEAELAERSLGESGSLHLAKAEAYRQRAMLGEAESEYERALKLPPVDETTFLSLSDTQYRLHRYQASADTLKQALTLSPDNPLANAQLARSYASLDRDDDATKAIQAAEKTGGNDYRILLATADALLVMGNRDQAMQRYTRALDLSDSDRLHVRLALARLFAQGHQPADVLQQVALAFAEARVTDPAVVTADDYLNAADILMSVNQFELAQRLFTRAEALGADQVTVATGIANASLALGDTRSAETLLTSMNGEDPNEQRQNYPYLVALGNVYRQRGDKTRALSLFAQANALQPDDPEARTAEIELAEDEGRQLKENLGFGSQFQVSPVFEDENIYQMDARLRGLQTGGDLLPTPRHSIETWADARYHLRLGSFPLISGFVAERNARGTISIPSQLLIQKRNTLDTILNFAVSPVIRLGSVRFTVTPGLQFTLRRDTLDPFDMNQNLFRQFLYVASSPIGNWLSFSGNVIREAGPFTEQNLHSRDFSGAIDFRLGRPWGKTAFLTGYSGRDLLFRPAIHEYFATSTYAGLERRIGSSLRISAAGEYLRAWRVEGNQFAIAQTLRPKFGLDFQAGPHWSLSAAGSWSQGKGFHSYDNVTTGFLVSYVREVRAARKDGVETTSVSYPMRLSFGVQQQTFYGFPGQGRTAIVPVVRFKLF